MKETYRIKIDRRGLPGSEQMRITVPYTLDDLKQMFSTYMEEGIIAGLSPREVRLVETAASALERLKEVESGQKPVRDNAEVEQMRRWAGPKREKRERDEEVGRWQQAIYEACCKTVRGLRGPVMINGVGCDSGDPLDLTLTEIGQAFNGLRDEIDLLTRERDEARKLAGEAWMAGCWLAGELMATTDLWLLLAKDFGDLYLDLKRVEEERDRTRAELVRAYEGIDEACTQNREMARRLELLLEGGEG